MRKHFFFLLAAFSSAGILSAQEDTLTIIGRDIQEIEVTARVEQPTDNHSTLSGDQLNKTNTGQNLPFLLSNTPSLVVTSDDGLGIGYTYFRIRGTDHSRINMTVNDVPLNDSESQTVFWVNMTDMASSLNSLNVQRGVGTSTNGSAAFGASLNMQTLPERSTLPEGRKAHVELRFNGGMYNTFREMAKAEVMLPNHFRVEARLSKVNSDGYLYRASSDLFSYHGSIGYYTPKTTVALSAFGGSEKTYMAWDGVTREDLIRDRRYNPAGEYTDKNGNTAYYPNQNDNYKQQHYQLMIQQRISQTWKFRGTLHYTHGGGFYEQMKANKKYAAYNLDNYSEVNAKGKTVRYYQDEDGNLYERTDFIRQKHLDNHFYGGIFSFDYRSEPADLTISAAGNHYIGNHWGYLHDDRYGFIGEEEFYRNHSDKADANLFAKANWRIINQARRQLTLYGDLQYRFVHYHLKGINDEDALPYMNILRNYHFFNPKAGITYQDNGHQVYFNFAIANREPSRSNFKESGDHNVPLPERLYDYELGYSWSSEKLHAGINLYYMDYKNQLVLTGQYSETGAYLTKNVGKSYRMGIELTGTYRPTEWFSWNAAITIARSRILDYTDWVTTYDADTYAELDQTEIHFGNVQTAFSPTVTFANTFTFRYAGFHADIQTTAVSKQYLDNTMSEEAVLKPYTVTNLTLQYTLPVLQRWCSISLIGQVNNLFNTAYESNGGNWMCVYTDGSRYYSPWYYAQAGTNVHAGIAVTF